MSTPFDPSMELQRDLRRWRIPAFAIGGVMLAAGIIGAVFSPADFFRSYLFGYLFWFAISLGSMAMVMMQYLTGGAWGVVSRRTFESASRTLPLVAILFIPVLIGIPKLYEWAHSDLVQANDKMQHRASYMNTPFFIVRAIIYFAIWLTFTYLLNRWSKEQDERGGLTSRLEALSAPGLILYVFTLTFAAVDWAESINSEFFSTIWGFLFVAGQGITALGFGIIVLALLSRRRPLSETLKPAHFQDLGKLMLMFVMLWAYFGFSQLLIIWAGNLPAEIHYYVERFTTSWGWLGVALIALQFFIPFLLLLSRPLKRNAIALSVIVLVLLIMRFVDLFWIVMPKFYAHGVHIHWLNFAVPIGIGGVWLGVFLGELLKWPLIPPRAANLEAALHHGEP